MTKLEKIALRTPVPFEQLEDGDYFFLPGHIDYDWIFMRVEDVDGDRSFVSLDGQGVIDHITNEDMVIPIQVKISVF